MGLICPLNTDGNSFMISSDVLRGDCDGGWPGVIEVAATCGSSGDGYRSGRMCKFLQVFHDSRSPLTLG